MNNLLTIIQLILEKYPNLTLTQIILNLEIRDLYNTPNEKLIKLLKEHYTI